MKKNFTGILIFGLVVAGIVSCSKDEISTDAGNYGLNATGTIEETAVITPADLTGKWEMFSMTSAETVDFNTDGTRTYDLLEETDCFDAMYFEFDSIGNVKTRQSRLYFDAVSGEFSCNTTGDYVAKYGVTGNELTVTFTIGDQTYSESKTISRYSESGAEFLKVTLTKTETNAAVYVTDDPGNTVASGISEIEMVYKKVL